MKENASSIFESNSQILAIDVANIKPLWDRLLVKDIPDPTRIGSLFIPETAAERGVGKDGRARLGTVVAVGPGDKFLEIGLFPDGQPRRRSLGPCWPCIGKGTYRLHKPLTGVEMVECHACHGDGLYRWPMNCKVGDTVIYDRRREAEVYIDGQRYSLINEEQSILGILDEHITDNGSSEPRR